VGLKLVLATQTACVSALDSTTSTVRYIYLALAPSLQCLKVANGAHLSPTARGLEEKQILKATAWPRYRGKGCCGGGLMARVMQDNFLVCLWTKNRAWYTAASLIRGHTKRLMSTFLALLRLSPVMRTMPVTWLFQKAARIFPLI
jgi:hypothetical protein